MAFVTKTWKDRLVEYAGRRKLKNVATGEEVLMDVSRSEGTVSQAGDAFSAANMNNLEQRIKNEFDTVNSSLQEVQNNSFKLEKLCNAQVLTMSQSNIAVSNITDYKFLYFYVNGDANDNADYGSLIIPVALFKNRTTYSCINCFSSTDYYASGRVAYSSDTSIKVSCTLKGWSKLYIHVYGIK